MRLGLLFNFHLKLSEHSATVWSPRTDESIRLSTNQRRRRDRLFSPNALSAKISILAAHYILSTPVHWN